MRASLAALPVLAVAALLGCVAPKAPPWKYRDPEPTSSICRSMEAFAAAEAPAGSCLRIGWGVTPGPWSVGCAVEGPVDARLRDEVCAPILAGGVSVEFGRRERTLARACGRDRRIWVEELGEAGSDRVEFAGRRMELTWKGREMVLRSPRGGGAGACGFPGDWS